MSIRTVAFSALSLLALAGCSDPAESSADGESDSLSANPNAGYFVVTHVDMRKCLAPLCGGYFVARVNESTTRCGDGTYHAECHVSEIDTSAIGLTDADDQKLRDGLAQGQALVRATLKKQTYGTATLGRLVAVEGWAGATTSTPTGTFYRAADNGIECFKAPCPTVAASKLNSKSASNIESVAFDKTSITANSKQIDLANADLATAAGVLVAGSIVTEQTKLGTEQTLVASEFYFPVVSASGKTCGGIAAIQCPSEYFCSYSEAEQCGAGDQSGTCQTEPQLCPMIVMPVCGCDNQTYVNACNANRAGVSVASSGACK